MNKNKPIYMLLCLVIIVLSTISGFIILHEKRNTQTYDAILAPTIVFKEKLIFELDIHAMDNNIEYLSQIVDEVDSNYDSIQSLSFSKTKVGVHRGEIIATLKDIKKTINFFYQVVDTQKPKIEILNDLWSYETYSIDWSTVINATDNSLPDGQLLPIEVIGEIDWYTSGEYEITITAKDASGNVEQVTTVVTVVEEPIIVITNPDPLPIEPQPVPAGSEINVVNEQPEVQTIPE